MQRFSLTTISPSISQFWAVKIRKAGSKGPPNLCSRNALSQILPDKPGSAQDAGQSGKEARRFRAQRMNLLGGVNTTEFSLDQVRCCCRDT